MPEHAPTEVVSKEYDGSYYLTGLSETGKMLKDIINNVKRSRFAGTKGFFSRSLVMKMFNKKGIM